MLIDLFPTMRIIFHSIFITSLILSALFRISWIFKIIMMSVIIATVLFLPGNPISIAIIPFSLIVTLNEVVYFGELSKNENSAKTC